MAQTIHALWVFWSPIFYKKIRPFSTSYFSQVQSQLKWLIYPQKRFFLINAVYGYLPPPPLGNWPRPNWPAQLGGGGAITTAGQNRTRPSFKSAAAPGPISYIWTGGPKIYFILDFFWRYSQNLVLFLCYGSFLRSILVLGWLEIFHF